MKAIGWNCRGKGRSLSNSPKMEYLSNSPKMEYLARLLNSTSAQVTFISETHSSKVTSVQLNSRFSTGDSFVVPSNGRSGGLWLLWSTDVHVVVKFFNQHLILAIVVNLATNLEFVLACVYGDPHHRSTRMIWEHVSTFVYDNLGKPVICLGDMNNIMCDMDSTSSNVNKCHMRAFNSYVKNCGLFYLGFSGPAYT